MFTKFYIAPFLKKHSFNGCCSFLLSAAVCLTLQTCTRTASDESMSITTVNVADSVVDNDGIKIVVDNTFAYPHSFSDRQLDTIKMQQMLCKTILGADMRHRGIHKMLREITTNEIDNYRPASRQKNKNAAISGRYEIRRSAKPLFYKAGILCFQATETTALNAKTIRQSNEYFNFSLAQMQVILLSDLFEPDNMEEISDLLKAKLLAANDCSSSKQLVQKGFFNLSTLRPSENFELTATGIRFHYAPCEIACFSVGAVSINLETASIVPYLKKSHITKILTEELWTSYQSISTT